VSDARDADLVQVHGRNLLLALHMLVRSVKLYDPQNAVFLKPLRAMTDAMTALIADYGKVEVAVVNGTFYVNSQLIRVDQANVEHLRQLAEELREHGLNGFRQTEAVFAEDIRAFVWVFSNENKDQPSEHGLPGRELQRLRLTLGEKLEERLDRTAVDGGLSDPRKQALTLYARAVVYLRAEMLATADGKAPAAGPIVRLVQDLIDSFTDHEALLLASMQNGAGDEAFAYHLANTGLLAIAFGRSLGLTRAQLRELGVAALVCELGMARLPAEARLSAAPERLAPEVQMQRLTASYQAAAALLAGPAVGRAQQVRALTAVLVHMPHSRIVTDANGQVTYQPQGNPLYVARILALCSYFDGLTRPTNEHAAVSPSQALAYMWARQRFRFDPGLLAAFVRVMARLPVKLRTG
jgi:HD-GYP domain-containing protein (c-di-GMP phosphodiesterase class II)